MLLLLALLMLVRLLRLLDTLPPPVPCFRLLRLLVFILIVGASSLVSSAGLCRIVPYEPSVFSSSGTCLPSSVHRVATPRESLEFKCILFVFFHNGEGRTR